MEKLRVAIKYLKSYFRTEWSAADYPLRVKHQPGQAPEYFVQVYNWWTAIGCGQTEDEAVADLHAFLERYHEANGQLPRPGTAVPLQFAPTSRVHGHWDLLERFICEVLSVPDGSPVLVTDESSLADFDDAVPDVPIEGRFQEVFGVDVSHMRDRSLADVFEFVAGRS